MTCNCAGHFSFDRCCDEIHGSVRNLFIRKDTESGIIDPTVMFLLFLITIQRNMLFFSMILNQSSELTGEKKEGGLRPPKKVVAAAFGRRHNFFSHFSAVNSES